MITYKVQQGSWGWELRRYENNIVTGAWVLSRSTAYQLRKKLLLGKKEIELGLN